MDQDQPRLMRRRLRQLGIALPLPATTAARALPPTPACDDGDDPTPAQTEGPYFTPNSPERASLLEAGMAGDRLTVAGTVLATDGIFREELLLDLRGGRQGSFTFVLEG
jgi:hypothetical protein